MPVKATPEKIAQSLKIGRDITTLPYRYATTVFNSVARPQAAMIAAVHLAVFTGTYATLGSVAAFGLALWGVPALFMGIAKSGRVENKQLATLDFCPSYQPDTQSTEKSAPPAP